MARSIRKDIVLTPGALAYVEQLMTDRGCGVSAAIAFVIFEHRLLSRIQDASKLRQDLRADVNELRTAARTVASTTPGSRERERAHRAADAAAERAFGRLVLITSV